jgi:phage baseplate assembly protein V
MSEQEIYDRRAMISRGVVHAVDDTSALQQVTVETHKGITRSGVEVYSPWGLVSVPPAGAEAVVLQVEGDPGDCIALPASHATARAGGAAEGTAGISDHGGNRMLVLPDGSVEIVSATKIILQVGEVTLLVNASGITLTTPTGTMTMAGTGVTFSQPVSIENELTVTGAVHGTADTALVADALK